MSSTLAARSHRHAYGQTRAERKFLCTEFSIWLPRSFGFRFAKLKIDGAQA